MKKTILLCFFYIIQLITLGQSASNSFVIKYLLSKGDLIRIEIICNPSHTDRRNCESDSLFIKVNNKESYELEVDAIEEAKLIAVIENKAKPLADLVGNQLADFCKKVKKEYDKYYGGTGKKVIDYSQVVKYNFNIYSDLYGISSNQPNGLIQPSLEVSFPFFRRGYYINKDRDVRIQFLRNIMPQITFSKLDNHLKDLPTLKSDTTRSNGILLSRANLSDVLQYSFLNFNLKINFFTITAPKHSFYVDLITTNYITSIYDSLHSQSISAPSYALGWDVKYATRFPGRFNFEVFWTRQYLKVISNDIAVSNGPQFKDLALLREAIKGNQIATANNSAGWFNSFGGQFSFWDADRKGHKFLKFSYYVNGKSQTFQNSFFQIQLGYSASLDDFIKSLSKN